MYMRLLGFFIISVLLSSCAYEPYARPRVIWEKKISDGKPSAKAIIETGVLIKWKQ